MVKFTDQFRHYLLGKEFILRTDHHSSALNFVAAKKIKIKLESEFFFLRMANQSHRIGKTNNQLGVALRAKTVVFFNFFVYSDNGNSNI